VTQTEYRKLTEGEMRRRRWRLVSAIENTAGHRIAEGSEVEVIRKHGGSYSWVGIYPTLKDGVVACYHWHLRGERDVQCEECRSVVLARRLGAAAEPSPLGCGLCDGSGWTPRCQADGCNEPGEPCGEILEGEEGREDTEYFCPKHAVDAGFCRACRCPIGLETAGQLCGECAWEARSDAMDEEDSWHGHEAGEDHDEDYP